MYSPERPGFEKLLRQVYPDRFPRGIQVNLPRMIAEFKTAKVFGDQLEAIARSKAISGKALTDPEVQNYILVALLREIGVR